MIWLKRIVFALEQLSFLWIGSFALMALSDKTIWYIPETIFCGIVPFIYFAEILIRKDKFLNFWTLTFSAVGMSIFWYEMALSSLADSTGPILIFTLPLLVIWQIETCLRYPQATGVMSFLWIPFLLVGVAIFIPMMPVRDYWEWNQDPNVPRHSIRSLIAAMSILLPVFYIASYRYRKRSR